MHSFEMLIRKKTMPSQSSNLSNAQLDDDIRTKMLLPCSVWRKCLYLQPQLEVTMQNRSVIRQHRKKHADLWQFRWWEKTSDGQKVYNGERSEQSIKSQT